MMETKWSSGEWHLANDEEWVYTSVTPLSGEDIICDLLNADGCRVANGQLIAAAPDLYRELAEVLDWATTERAPLRKQEIESIRAVLAKARGEQP